MTSEQRSALIALAHAVEPGDARLGALVAGVGPVEALARIQSSTTGVAHSEGARLRLAAACVDEAEERAAAVGGRIVTRVDREWPTQLDGLGDQAPMALWIVGAANLRLIALRSLAMVGARACTAYGEEVARAWAADLAGDGWCVVSGGAFGIDAAAHRGVLDARGVTMCVLAGGVDMPYPRAHDLLIARIADEGLVVSESPPGESVRRQRFLSRNRVIAAVSRATLVIEAASRSGTIATARAAAAMNRPVLAVPGPVTSPASAGCHRMIRDEAAILVESAQDVIELLDLSGGVRASSAQFRVDEHDRLSASEKRVLDALSPRIGVGVEAISAAAALPLAEVWPALGVLEARGWVRQDTTGWRVARLTRAAPRG